MITLKETKEALQGEWLRNELAKKGMILDTKLMPDGSIGYRIVKKNESDKTN